MFFSQNGVTSTGADTVAVAILTIFTIASMLALVVFLCKFADGGNVARKKSALAIILAVGFVIRLIFVFSVRGYRADYKLFTDMFDNLKNHGVGEYYGGDATSVLYPIVYFIYLIFGGISNASGLSSFALGTQFMVKLPLVIADLLIALAVYKIAVKYFNAKVGLTLAAFVCVCPVFFIGSVVWVTPLVFTAMFLCYACYFLARKNYSLTFLFSMLAAFSSKEGIYVFPIICVFAGFHFVRAIMALRDARKKATSESAHKSILTAETRAVVEVPVSLVLSCVAVYLLGLVMTFSHSYNPFVYIYEFLIAPLVDWSYFTYNGLSIYNIFGQNGVERSLRFPSWVFVCVFAVIVITVVCVVYFTKRNRATLVMLAAYVLFTMQIYYPSSSAVGLAFALPVLLAAYALMRDKRLLIVLFAAGIAFTINSLSIVAISGFLSNADDFMFTAEAFPSAAALTGGYLAIPIVCSAIAVAAHLFFTVVTVGAGMTGIKKPLAYREGLSASLKELFKRTR